MIIFVKLLVKVLHEKISILNHTPEHLPAQSYNRNTRTRSEIRSKLTIKTPGVFIINFEYISHLVLLFLLLTLNM